MIVKIPLVLVLVISIKDISSISISKVYVKNGFDYPAEYVQYGTPVSYNPAIAQLTAAPIGSVSPYSSNYVPCGTPCVYPGVASVVPSANVVQYQSPNLPVVVAQPKTMEDPDELTKLEIPSGYEYSYSVFDEQTGDQKTQRELSDGSLVRGGYSFLQPDGFIRDVQYVADDVRGFNAVVKNYLPVTVETKKPDPTEKPEPCPEVKSDSLKVDESKASEEPSHESLKEDPQSEQTSGDPEPAEEPAAEGPPPEEPTETPKVEEQPQENAEPEIPPRVYEIAYVTFGAEPKVSEESTKPSEESETTVVPEVPENVDTAVVGQDSSNSNVLVSYNDIIRCIQAALGGVQETSLQRPESPLTYIILNKPC